MPLGKIGPPSRIIEAGGVPLETWESVADAAWWLTDADRTLLEYFCWTSALWHITVAAAMKRKTEPFWPPGAKSLGEQLLRQAAALGLDPARLHLASGKSAPFLAGARTDPRPP